MVNELIPIIDWLPHYKPEWLRFDIIAALSVWALLVPQSIAYGSIAGVPLQFGLYAALGALIGYALFGTSGQVITGPSAAIATVSASVVGVVLALLLLIASVSRSPVRLGRSIKVIMFTSKPIDSLKLRLSQASWWSPFMAHYSSPMLITSAPPR